MAQPQWKPIATSTQNIGTGAQNLARYLTIQVEGMGAGDILVVAGRVPGAVNFQPISLIKKGTQAVIPGATGIANDPDTFLVDATGLEVQLQYTKVTNNAVVNWSETTS